MTKKVDSQQLAERKARRLAEQRVTMTLIASLFDRIRFESETFTMPMWQYFFDMVKEAKAKHAKGSGRHV